MQSSIFSFFFFNDTATTEIYTLSLHDALPISTLAQILVLMPEQKIESLPNFWDLRTALGAQQEGMKVFGSAPLWLRESLIFPYPGERSSSAGSSGSIPASSPTGR